MTEEYYVSYLGVLKGVLVATASNDALNKKGTRRRSDHETQLRIPLKKVQKLKRNYEYTQI